MKLRRYLFFGVFVPIFGFSACSTASKNQTVTAPVTEKVISRSDDFSARPGWASQDKRVAPADGNTHFIGVVELPVQTSTGDAFKMSDDAARGNLSEKIKTNVTAITHSAKSGLSMDELQLNSMIQAVGQIDLHEVEIKERYWEKVADTDALGTETSILRALSLISLSDEEIKKVVMDSVDSYENSLPATRAEFKGILNDKWQPIVTE